MKEIQAMEDERKEQHDAFLESKADDEGAVKLLEKAIEALSAFYGNNKGTGMGDVQGSTKLLQDPSTLTDEDDAPDATFSSAGTGRVRTRASSPSSPCSRRTSRTRSRMGLRKRRQRMPSSRPPSRTARPPSPG